MAMRRFFFSPSRLNKYRLFAGDMALAAVTLAAGHMATVGVTQTFVAFLPLALLAQAAAHYAGGLYEQRAQWPGVLRTAGTVLVGLAGAAPLQALASLLLSDHALSAVTLVVHAALFLPAAVGWRTAHAHYIAPAAQPRSVLIAAPAEQAPAFARLVDALTGYRVAAIVVPPAHTLGARVDLDQDRSVPVATDLATAMQSHPFTDLAVDFARFAMDDAELYRVVETAYRERRVHDLPVFVMYETGAMPVDLVEKEWLVQAIATRATRRLHHRVKRLVDLTVASCALVLLMPLMLVIGLGIRLDSRGPALFIQERLGHHRHPFRFYKFRSMMVDAEAATGAVWAAEDDPRVTRFGRFLRKSRLDELPQLFNVVVGDLSLVGPRPIREHFRALLAKDIPFYDLRFMVKPGVTGWSQVMGSYPRTVEEQFVKFKQDLFYMHNNSIALDLYVIFRTVRVMFSTIG